ncbi:MAG: hypothetical protein PWP15_1126 [Methanothermococcus sp.]|nr:hypothetical protein [Methanothermococcus sp.]
MLTVKNDEIHIVLPIKPATKKNSGRIVFKGKRPIILPSKKYIEFRDSTGYFINHKYLNIDYPVNLKCIVYIEKNYSSDLSNYIEAIQDMLVYYKVIKDDNHKIVESLDGSRVYVDRKNPRVEITITKK